VTFWLWFVPACVSAVAVVVGRHEELRGMTWVNVPLRTLWAVTSVLVVVLAFTLREDVGVGQFLFGVVVGVVGLAIIPVFAFYVIGRLVKRVWLAALLWLLGTLVLAPYCLIVGLLFALGVACEPNCLS
jgi:hypothetical protein